MTTQDPNTPCVHSIFLTSQTGDVKPVHSDQVRLNFDSIAKVLPNYKHIIHDGLSIRALIQEKFSAEVLWAYDRLIPLAYKADLARYCLLFLYGGIYADLSIYFFSSPYSTDQYLNRLLVYADTDHFKIVPWTTSNGLIAAPRGLELFLKIIHRIVEHTRSEYYGPNSLFPTGPNLFGKLLAEDSAERYMICGQVNRINRKDYPNFSYLSPSGDLVAISYKSERGFSGLGLHEEKSYKQLFAERRVYDSDGQVQVWGALDFLFKGICKCRHRATLKSVQLESDSGCLLLGPKLLMNPGEHQILIHLSNIKCTSVGTLTLRANCSDGQDVVVFDHNLNHSVESVEFSGQIQIHGNNIEVVFSLWATSRLTMQLHHLSVIKL